MRKKTKRTKLFTRLWESAGSICVKKNERSRHVKGHGAILTQFSSRILGHDHRLFPLSGYGVATQMFRIFPGIRCCNDRREFMALRGVVRAACSSFTAKRIPPVVLVVYIVAWIWSVTGVSDRHVRGGLIGIYVGGVYSLPGISLIAALSKLLFRMILCWETCHSCPRVRVNHELTWTYK